MIRAKSGVPLKRTHLWFWTIPVCRVFPQKNRKQPAGIIREMPRTLAPMALRPCLSTSLPKNCPIFLKIDTLVLSTIVYHTPPVSTGFTGVLFIFYVVFFSNAAENVYILMLSLFHFLFCKVRKKVAGEPFQALRAGSPKGKRLLSRFKPQKLISVPLPLALAGFSAYNDRCIVMPKNV